MRIALVQMDTTEEQPEINLKKIIEFSKRAIEQGAKIVMFHENTLTDYVSSVDKFAEEAPNGDVCKEVWRLAEQNEVFISFGLIEKEGAHRYITQVFLGPNKYFYRYRKTWLYSTTDRIKSIRRHRDEPSDFDPGDGPEIFEISGLKASCIICSDGMSLRCLKIVKELKPEILFYPNNREIWRNDEYWIEIAKKTDTMLLITNRVGKSWGENCEGGCSVYSKKGEVLAKSNINGEEEILLFDLGDLK